MRAKYFLFFLTKRLPIIKKVKISGRSRSGQIICYNRGGGLKKLYRKIDIHKFI
jgi:ribosomal protein L2